VGKAVGPIYVAPQELDFGTCSIGRRGSTRIAWLFNPWWNNGAVTIGNATIQGSTDFSIDSGDTTCKSTLTVGSLCAIAIQFNPSTSGSRHGQLVIQDTAANSPQTVSLDGSGDEHFGR
jgi:hypothetical protein